MLLVVNRIRNNPALYRLYKTGYAANQTPLTGICKVDSSGRFQFSDAANPAQMTLFGHEPDVTALKRLSVVYICQLVHAVPWNVNPALPELWLRLHHAGDSG